VREVLAEMPESVLVLDLAAGAADCLHLLEEVSERRSSAVAIVIGPREAAELEWAARELGAIDFLFEAAAPYVLARLCGRQLKAPFL
jgi:DNA-binding NtrC family response regulator